MGNPFSNLGPLLRGPVNVESQILTSIPVLSTIWTEILGIFRRLAAKLLKLTGLGGIMVRRLD
jgi:hypothetical protein